MSVGLPVPRARTYSHNDGGSWPPSSLTVSSDPVSGSSPASCGIHGGCWSLRALVDGTEVCGKGGGVVRGGGACWWRVVGNVGGWVGVGGEGGMRFATYPLDLFERSDIYGFFWCKSGVEKKERVVSWMDHHQPRNVRGYTPSLTLS